MIFGIVSYSPLDIDTLLAGHNRTTSPSDTADVFYAVSFTETYKAKVCLLFNSLEYCEKRKVKVLDNGVNIQEVARKIKEAL